LRLGDLRVEQLRAHCSAGDHPEAAGIGNRRDEMALANPAHRAAHDRNIAAEELGAAMHQLFEPLVAPALVDRAGIGNQLLPTHATCSASSPKAVWSTRTASSVYSSGRSTETLISEVEMARMLIPRSARVSNIFAAIPALERMPMPTALTFTTSVLVMRWSKPISAFAFSSAATAWASEAVGTVKVSELDRPVPAPLWTIMSTLMLAAASGAKIAATVPGLSGNPVSVTRASFLSWAIPVTSWRSMLSSSIFSSPTIRVPGRSSKDERTCSGML